MRFFLILTKEELEKNKVKFILENQKAFLPLQSQPRGRAYVARMYETNKIKFNLAIGEIYSQSATRRREKFFKKMIMKT